MIFEKEINKLNINIYGDGAYIPDIVEQNKLSWIKGFTTNPTLMKKSGVKNYKNFALELMNIVQTKPVSFEVFSDDLMEMKDQALEISSWHDNIYVKIPITNTKGEYTYSLISELSENNVKCNVTAIFTLEQSINTINSIKSNTPSIISIFAGRIADTGKDPATIIMESVRMSKDFDHMKILWASPREILNIFQADDLNCDIITVAGDILSKIKNIGKNLDDFSLETVKMFYEDAKSSEFKIEIRNKK